MRVKFKKILCAVDFSDNTNRVMSYGKALAAEFNAEIILCHVVSFGYLVSGHIPPHEDHTGMEVYRMEQARARLDALSKEFDMDCRLRVCAGHAAEEIARIAKEEKMDMVLAATCGGAGVKRFLLGSVTDRLARILSCPFMVLHPQEEQEEFDHHGIELKKILVGCDFSPDSKLAFDYAQSLAQEFQAKLYLAHVIPTVEYFGTGTAEYLSAQEELFTGWHDAYQGRRQSILDRMEARLLGMVSSETVDWCTHEAVVLEGRVYQELLTHAEQNNIDMIVVGVRGHSLLEEFIIGSTTHRVVSRASCPVLVIRQPGNDIEHFEENNVDDQDIRQLRVKDVMERDVISITPNTDIKKAAKLLWDNHINGMPVLNDEGGLEGIICQSDLILVQKGVVLPNGRGFDDAGGFSLLGRSKEPIGMNGQVTVDQVMERHVIWVGPDTGVVELADLMVERCFHTIPVLKDNIVVGIVGKEDLLRLLINRRA